MNFDLLLDPLFRVPFLTGLLLAGLLPLIDHAPGTPTGGGETTTGQAGVLMVTGIAG